MASSEVPKPVTVPRPEKLRHHLPRARVHVIGPDGEPVADLKFRVRQAYELSVLTGTQVLLLVVSETGLVYTFTTPKLQPLVTKAEGKNLIQVRPSRSRTRGVAWHASALRD